MPKNVETLKVEVKNYLALSSLDNNEKNMIRALSYLLDLFYYFVKKDYSKIDKDDPSFDQSLNNKISKIYDEVTEFLKQNYQPKEFCILDVTTFSDSSAFLSKLLENLLFYFRDYEEEEKYINIYYYIFHLIYYILSIFINQKGTNIFNEDSIKFYVYHIVHFFLNEKKNPEYNFFFYEGALKYLSKKFNISICFLFKLSYNNIILRLTIQNDINEIIKKYRSQLLNKNNQSENEMNFIGNYKKISKEIADIVNIRRISENNDDDSENNDDDNSEENKLLNICETIKSEVEQVKKILNNYNLSCTDLEDYEKSIDKFIKTINTYNLTESHFNLMPLNYNYSLGGRTELKKYLEMSEIWVKYNEELEQDNTILFWKIINSGDFKELFITVMTSSYVEKFAKDNNLKKEYKMFIKVFAPEIWKYVLFMPLTRGIKAYVANYFRIVININSVDLIDIPDDKTKEEILKSYLLILLIHESFHFLFRLDKKGETVTKALSPISKKLKEYYKEIGVDIILYLFGTEYITFISIENSKLLNDKESWKNQNTNFKVFKEIYLSDGKLIGNEKKNEGSGLRCYISVNENNYDNSEKWMICTDCVVRYCF